MCLLGNGLDHHHTTIGFLFILNLEPPEGLEPPTLALQVRCSAIRATVAHKLGVSTDEADVRSASSVGA